MSATSSWTGLPDIALVEVFSYLATPQDRWNASLVCKHWSRFFSHPKIWEDVELTSEKSDELTVKSIRRFGAHFRKVKVYNSTFFFGVRDILREIAQRCEKVKVFILEPTFRTHEPIYLGIMAELMATFTKLHNMKEVRLPFLQTTGSNCYNPLKSIDTNSAQTLSVLDVTEFTRHPRPLSSVLKLKHLKSLGISYQNLTVDILLAMKEHRTLQDLTIVRSHAKPQSGNGTTLPGSVWKDLQYELPDLRVHLVYTEEAPLTSCPKGIPVVSYAVADHNNANAVQLNRMVSKLILMYSETLENFVIRADNSFYWDLQLAQLARKCPNLRAVIVDGTVTLGSLVLACRHWKKLELLYVKESNVESSGKSMYQVDTEQPTEELSRILGYPWQPLGDEEFFQRTKKFLRRTLTTAVLRRPPPKVYDKGYRY